MQPVPGGLLRAQDNCQRRRAADRFIRWAVGGGGGGQGGSRGREGGGWRWEVGGRERVFAGPIWVCGGGVRVRIHGRVWGGVSS